MYYSDIPLEPLIDQFLEALKPYVSSESCLSNYVNSARAFKNYAKKNEVQFFSEDFMDSYEKYCHERKEAHKISVGYFRFTTRFIRIFGGYAESGTIDYSRKQVRKRYEVSEEENREILAILAQSDVPESSLPEIGQVLRHLFVYGRQFGKMPDCISDDILLSFYLEELPKTNKGSMGRSLRALKIASEYWKKNGFELTLDFTQLHVPGRNTKHINPYLADEVAAILNEIDDSKAGIRNKAMILLGYEAALRSVDVLTLKLSEIDWKNRIINTTQSKTGQLIIIPMTGRVMNAVADYILKVRPEGIETEEVFLTVKGPLKAMRYRLGLTQIVEKYEKAAGIDKQEGRGFHSLRRGWASNLSAAGVDIEMISQLLGHTSIDEDRPYLTYNREQISFCAIGFEEIPITYGIYGSEAK